MTQSIKNNPMNSTTVKPLVSLILPAYNESAILAQSMAIITSYIEQFNSTFSWEIILVNDGSKDDTGTIADNLAQQYPYLKVIHHVVNLNLGNALKTGFANSSGAIVITLDLDLSYSVEHIGTMLQTIVSTHADMVVASPYMKGGKVTGVPFIRIFMSKWVNWLMSLSAQEKFKTFTCMVRAYRGDFIRTLNLKTRDYEINPEIMYKAMILRARIIEIPAHLDWSFQNKAGKARTSGLKITKGVFSGLMASFMFRPYMYFLLSGTALLVVFLYLLIWILINIYTIYPTIVSPNYYFDDKFSLALAQVFRERPHAFAFAGISLLVALQFFSIGFLSLQNKRYFEELFHISSSIKKNQ
jgi:glycosyltransferase involved in cell wall biosynthesis